MTNLPEEDDEEGRFLDDRWAVISHPLTRCAKSMQIALWPNNRQESENTNSNCPRCVFAVKSFLTKKLSQVKVTELVCDE